jgi:isopenicillin N synthase-like dioxygenase
MGESVSAALVDLSLWKTDKAALVAQVGASAKDTGFLQVYNHGIPAASIEAAFAASRGFFALPDADKARTPFVGWAGGWEKEQQARAAPCCARVRPPWRRGWRIPPAPVR